MICKVLKIGFDIFIFKFFLQVGGYILRFFCEDNGQSKVIVLGLLSKGIVEGEVD